MKRVYLICTCLAFLLFIATFISAVFEFTGAPSSIASLNYQTEKYQHNEAFDPSLARLDNLTRLTAYCDSLFSVKKGLSNNTINAEKEFPLIASEVVRNRFYHGLSSFGFGNNYLAYLANPFYMRMFLNAPVKTNDILKFPAAICSQQAMVLMALLQKKGYPVRKVGFIRQFASGHFCLEAFYANSWHYFDTDLEPDTTILNAYDRPGIKFLVENREILKKVYIKEDPVKIATLFPSYFYGKVNEPLAGKAAIYGSITKFLSYTIWIFFLLAFSWARRKYLRLSNYRYVRNRRFSLSELQPG
jgi:hypothetical protein